MAEILNLPSASAVPVQQTRIRGRLPRAVGNLRQARIKRRDEEERQAGQRLGSLHDEVAEVITSWDLDPSERRVLGSALSILESKLKSGGALFDSPSAVKCFLSLRLAGLPHEEFGVLFLDSQNRLIAFERLFRGTLTQTSVYPREVVLRSLAHRANAVVLAHNHPSGEPRPSRADESLTEALKAALALVGVRVLDHFIVAGMECCSMAEMGLV